MSIILAEPRPSPDLMTSQQVANRLAISIRTLWRLVRANKVPQPVRYNRKLVRWKTTDLSRYIATLSVEARVGPCEPSPGRVV